MDEENKKCYICNKKIPEESKLGDVYYAIGKHPKTGEELFRHRKCKPNLSKKR